MKAKYVIDITVKDPDTDNDIEITVFKHENGGMFAIDASYIDFIDEGDNEAVFITDPFVQPKGSMLELIWPEL